jgi:carboxylesterase type B
MFEYHGTSAAPWYDGSRFARDGVVCVTINYRVGAVGFLDLGEGNANRGLLDQVAALTWVRDNITAFGGDPDNVTIFGQSAGAMSVALLLAVPRAAGLFRRAIAQSGAAEHVSTRGTAARIARELAAKLGVAPTCEAIAALPIERVIAAQAALRAELEAGPDPARWGGEVIASMLPWQPVIDGDVLPAVPLERIAGGAGAGIDLLVGSNDDENRLFLVSIGGIEQVPDAALAGIVAAYGLPVEATLAAYRAAGRGTSAGELMAAIQTDGYWRLPAIRLADAHATGRGPGRTFMYEFAWRSPQFDGKLGACHTLEIPFVFDTLGLGTGTLWGPAPPQPLADTMHAAWVAFATRGECPWPAYDPARRATMRFDTKSTVVDDPRAAERSLWAVGGLVPR